MGLTCCCCTEGLLEVRNDAPWWQERLRSFNRCAPTIFLLGAWNCAGRHGGSKSVLRNVPSCTEWPHVGMEQRSFLVFEGLGSSGAACAREVPVASDAALRTLPAQHCQPSALGISPLRLHLASANPLWSQSAHCVPGLCQVQCGEWGGKTWSLWSSRGDRLKADTDNL